MSIAMTMVLPEPVAIFEQRRGKFPPSEECQCPTRSDGGTFQKPDQGFDGFELAEEETAIFALFGVSPVFGGVLSSPVTPG